MSLRQVRLVAMREVMYRLRNRAYQLSTLTLAVLSVAGVLAVQVLPDFFEDEPVRLGLVPATADRAAPVRDAAAAFDREIELIEFPEVAEAERALVDGEVDALLLAPDRLDFHEDVDAVLEGIVRQSLFGTRFEERASALGLTLEEAQSLLAPVEVESRSLEPDEASDDEAGEDASVGQGFGTLSSIVLLLAITFYGQWVVVGVIEEKSNRVVEVLLAAVRPEELLVGKVLGILVLGMIQVAVSVAALLGAIAATAGLGALPDVALAGLAVGVLWLLLGLLLYNFLYAAVGATVSRPDEATSVTFPLMFPLMGGYFAGIIFIPSDPDSLISRVLSIFPLTAPLTMPSRIASGGGSAVEVVLAVILALVALVAIVWLAGRIYAGGILQGGKIGLASAFRRARDIR